jgi:hypothetical protein
MDQHIVGPYIQQSILNKKTHRQRKTNDNYSNELGEPMVHAKGGNKRYYTQQVHRCDAAIWYIARDPLQDLWSRAMEETTKVLREITIQLPSLSIVVVIVITL